MLLKFMTSRILLQAGGSAYRKRERFLKELLMRYASVPSES
ncbi:hypothetical protein AB5I39_03820 [Sphingomonas sp. MMS24-J45]